MKPNKKYIQRLRLRRIAATFQEIGLSLEKFTTEERMRILNALIEINRP